MHKWERELRLRYLSPLLHFWEQAISFCSFLHIPNFQEELGLKGVYEIPILEEKDTPDAQGEKGTGSFLELPGWGVLEVGQCGPETVQVQESGQQVPGG